MVTMKMSGKMRQATSVVLGRLQTHGVGLQHILYGRVKQLPLYRKLKCLGIT